MEVNDGKEKQDSLIKFRVADGYKNVWVTFQVSYLKFIVLYVHLNHHNCLL
jgi:hypothetical protein